MPGVSSSSTSGATLPPSPSSPLPTRRSLVALLITSHLRTRCVAAVCKRIAAAFDAVAAAPPPPQLASAPPSVSAQDTQLQQLLQASIPDCSCRGLMNMEALCLHAGCLGCCAAHSGNLFKG